MFHIPIDTRRTPVRQDGEVQATCLGLLWRDIEAPGRAILDEGATKFQSCDIGEAEPPEFGKQINPHPFQSCLATSTAIYHGAEIGLAMTVLEHTSSEVFERYYNQAKMIDAVKAYQEILLANPQG